MPDGRDVFINACGYMIQALNGVTTPEGMQISDLDYIICHQANRRIIEYVMKKMPGYEHKFYINIEKYANTSAASIPILMDEMRSKKILHKGDVVLVVAFGAGLTWGSALFTF